MDGIVASDPISRSGRTQDRDADRAQARRRRQEREARKKREATAERSSDTEVSDEHSDDDAPDESRRGKNVDIVV